VGWVAMPPNQTLSVVRIASGTSPIVFHRGGAAVDELVQLGPHLEPEHIGGELGQADVVAVGEGAEVFFEPVG
jgi:hypothetical protein